MKLAKKLQLLKSQGSLASEREAHELKQNLSDLATYLGTLGEKIEKLTNIIAIRQKNQSRANEKSLSERKSSHFFDTNDNKVHNVVVPLPKIINRQGDKSQRGAQIQIFLNWVGQVCKTVFEKGSQLYKSGQLQENKIKSYLSQNIIRNILLLCQKQDIGYQIFQRINKCLKQQLIPYYCKKYLQSEQKFRSKRISDSINQRIINENMNDLVFRSGIKFSFDKNGNYNSQIMQFLNYVINLPHSILKIGQQDSNIGEQFHRDMQNIFTKIQSKRQKINMLKYDIKNPLHNHQSQNNSSIQNNQQYAQKIKSFTNYHIGQKLPQNLKPYSQYEIKTGNLKLNDSSLIKLVTKWCQELWQNFDQVNFLKRQNVFRMKDGNQNNLNKFQRNILNLYLQKQKRIILQKVQNIMNNNYYEQSQFGKKIINKKLIKFSKQQAIVGQFSSSIYKLNENYLINYINILIHGLNRASQQFEKFQIRYGNKEHKQVLQNLYEKENKKFDSTLLNKIENYLKENNSPGQALSSTPQLISFKVSDILRCKCVSKQNEILSLYKEVQRISSKDPKNIKIISVRNKLHQPTRDIIINFIYKQKIIVEMELAIRIERSKLTQYSNNLNNYLDQIKLYQFGPITSICSIWASEDSRAQIYLQKLQSANIRQKSSKKLCCNDNQGKKVTELPFGCDSCHRFYYDCAGYQSHVLCKKCRKFTCYLCQLQAQPEEIFKQIPIQKNGIDLKLSLDIDKLTLQESIPEKGGGLLNLKSKQRKIVIFSTIVYNNQYHMYQCPQNNQKLKLIHSFKDKKLSKKFLKDNLIMLSPQLQQLIQNIPIERVEKQQIIPEYQKN